MSLHSHFDASKWEGMDTHLSPFCSPAEPLPGRFPERSSAGYYPEAGQVQRGMLLAQRELLLDEIQRTRRQQAQLEGVIAEYEARLAVIEPEIEAIERQNHTQSAAGDEPAESVHTLLRGAR